MDEAQNFVIAWNEHISELSRLKLNLNSAQKKTLEDLQLKLKGLAKTAAENRDASK